MKAQNLEVKNSISKDDAEMEKFERMVERRIRSIEKLKKEYVHDLDKELEKLTTEVSGLTSGMPCI